MQLSNSSCGNCNCILICFGMGCIFTLVTQPQGAEVLVPVIVVQYCVGDKGIFTFVVHELILCSLDAEGRQWAEQITSAIAATFVALDEGFAEYRCTSGQCKLGGQLIYV